MNQPAKLGSNIMALSVLQLMNYAVPLITVPYLTRVLGPANFGLMAFAQALILYFDLITDYGFNLSATRRVVTHRGDRAALSRVFWITYAAKFILLFACGVALAILLSTVPALARQAPLYEATFLTVVGGALFPVWLVQGMEQMKLLTISHASARIFSIPVLLLWVRNTDDYVRAAAVQGAVPIVASLVLAPLLWRRIRIRVYRPNLAEILGVLRDGRHLFLSNVVMNVYSATTVFVLGLVAGNIQVGYYSAADKLIRAATSLVNPLSQALYPHLSALRLNSTPAALRLIKKSLIWVGSVTLAGALAIFFLAQPIGHLLFGDPFGPSAEILQCLAPLLFVTGMNSVLATQTMMVFGLDNVVSRIMLRVLVINGVLTLWLATYWGARGAAIATVASSLTMMLQMIIALHAAKLPVWKSPRKEVVEVAEVP
jgi:PST family polysaccharide transporter